MLPERTPWVVLRPRRDLPASRNRSAQTATPHRDAAVAAERTRGSLYGLFDRVCCLL